MSAARSSAVPDPGLDVFWHSCGLDIWRPAWLKADRLPRWIAANIVVALVYAALGVVVARFFGAYGLFPSPIWLPAGIACVAAMVGGTRLLPGVFAGSLLVNWGALHSPLGVAAMISTTNALGPFIGALVTRAMRPDSGLFTRFRGTVGFILGGVLLHAAITGAGGTLAMSLLQPPASFHAYHVFTTWWLCDSGGTFFFAPALLLWLGAERTPPVIDHSGSVLDFLVLLSTLAAAALLFLVPDLGRLVRPDVVFLLTVPLSWITLRVSLRGAYTLLTLVCVIATTGTVMGEGPFNSHAVSNPLQSVALMTVLFAMDALTLIALTSERREAEARLLETRDTLESVSQRSERLQRESLTDPLTGIGNRRLFVSVAGEEFLQARTADRPFAVILLDLDHFKDFNDKGGHALGDTVLQAVAQALATGTRSQDIVARIGGEEFAIAMPDTDMAAAAEAADRLRQMMPRVRPRGGRRMPQPITASFGVSVRCPADRRLEDLLSRADAAVYRAKADGRDRVERAPADRPDQAASYTS